MLFVLEGLDGAGKSTQVGKMREYLESRCGELEYIHFPRYDAPLWGGLIGRFLRGDYGTIDSVHPQLVALLYAGDRHDAAPSIRKTLSEGGTVLLDRYVYSNIAYQCAKVPDPDAREELRKWIIDTEYGNFGLPEPDLNIFLDVPIGFVREKLTASRQGDDRGYLEGRNDIHEANIEFQKRVREVYLTQTLSDPGFSRVDCSDGFGRMLPPDEIFRKVKDLVDKKLDRK